MLDILEALFTQYGYAAVFVVLVACGFGIPIPEDITLIAGGVISGLGHSNAHIMVVVGMIGVLTGDGMMFLLGHFYGDRILKARYATCKCRKSSTNTAAGYYSWPVSCPACAPPFSSPPA